MAPASSVRTPEELRDITFNYFIAFKISLNETDVAKIEPQIKKVLGDPKGGVQSRRLLELKNDILEIMCNDSVYDENSGTYKQNAGGRKKEAENAKKLKLKEALDIIQSLCTTRTTLLKSEIKKIYDSKNTPVAFFTEAEFDNAIKPLLSIGVKVIDNMDASIPFDKYNKAEQLLKPLSKKDLYDFLGGSDSLSMKDLEDKNNQQYASSQKISDLKKKQSISGLCAVVKELILSSPQSKKNYDNYLALKDEVWADFEKRKSVGIKEINIDEYGKYAQKVVDILRVNVQEAEKMLAVGCKYFQLTIIGINEISGGLYDVCPHPDCGLLFPKGAKSCPHCGKPLEVICWNCKQKTPLTKDDKGCPSCGATYHAHSVYLAKSASLDALLTKEGVDVAQLQTALLEVKNVVPDYASRTDSTLYLKVQEYEKVISARVKQEETIGASYRDEIAKIRELVSAKKYQSAFSIANSLSVKYGTYNLANSKKILADITLVLSNAQKQVDMAKAYTAQGNANMAIIASVKAIEICEDHIEARQILQKFPPKPVSNLKAVLDGNKIRLEWQDNIKQEFTTYTIIKKIGVAPVNAQDGALVDKGLSIKFFEDKNVISATPYYYAVFAERCGVVSQICATTQSVMAFADVANVQQVFANTGVKASWEAPQNVKSFEVWKKEGPVAPLKAGDGVKIPADAKGFYDEKCDGENSYLIICNYLLNGKQIQSSGIRIVFKPFEKIMPLENIEIESIGPGKYTFACKEGYVGNVSLYYAKSKLPIQTDTITKFLDFDTVCKGLTKIATTLTVEGKIAFSIPQGQICQVYPIVTTEQLFIVSPPRLLNTVEGIKASHTVANGVVTITGTLHPKAEKLIVKVSHDNHQEKIDGSGENFTFLKDVFNKQGKVELKLKTNTVNYITLFAEITEDDVKTYSQPVKLNPPIDYREAVTVLYSMQYTTSAVRPYKVVINFEADKPTEIPTLLLMKGYPRPMTKNAGELCERLKPLKLKKGLFSRKYTGKYVINVSPSATNTKYAIFVTDGGEHVTLKEVRHL